MAYGSTNVSETLRSFHLDLPRSIGAVYALLIARYPLYDQARIITSVLYASEFQMDYYNDPKYLKFPDGEILESRNFRGEGLAVTTDLGVFLGTIYALLTRFGSFEAVYGYSMTPLKSWINESEATPVKLSFGKISTKHINVSGSKEPLIRSFRNLVSADLYHHTPNVRRLK